MLDFLSKLGDYSKPKPRGYYFSMDEWVKPIEINHQFINVKLEPKMYFVTSGEAVIKAVVLESDIWGIYKRLIDLAIGIFDNEGIDLVDGFRHNKLSKYDKNLSKYLIESWKSAAQARHLVIHLTEARSTNLFLETDWQDGHIICYPKNPRGVDL